MNWKLKFSPKGTFIEFYNTNGRPILSRRFQGWEIRDKDSEDDLVPKFELFENEIKVKKDDNNIFIEKIV